MGKRRRYAAPLDACNYPAKHAVPTMLNDCGERVPASQLLNADAESRPGHGNSPIRAVF